MRRGNYIQGAFLVIMMACTCDGVTTAVNPSSTRTYENVLTAPTPVPGKSVNPTATPPFELVDFNVKDVRIDAPEKEVLEKLGRPTRRSKAEVENCGEEAVLRLNYPGLEIDLSLDETGKNYVALSFLVSTSKWDIGKGIRIGSPFNRVVATFGKPWNERYNTGTESLGYSAAPGNDVGELSFRNGKLFMAKWYVDPC